MKRLPAEVLDALALDFALGMLCASARRRYLKLKRSDAVATRAHDAWQQRTRRLMGAVAPCAPREALRFELHRRLQESSPTSG